MKLIAYVLSLLCCLACSDGKRVRIHESFNSDWQFALADSSVRLDSLHKTNLSWQPVDLPHDWSIEADFSNTYPATPGGGALPGGVGWYRKTFSLPETDRGKAILIGFDGVYWCSTVWINGHNLGFRPNGYTSFVYDLSPYLHFGEEHNELVVGVDNSQQPNSRWYTGSGITRNVWITKTHPIRVETWGTAVTTPQVSRKKATVAVNTSLTGCVPGTTVTLRSTLLTPSGSTVGRIETDIIPTQTGQTSCSQSLEIDSPRLWSPDTPQLYTVWTEVLNGGTVTDDYETPFGIRSLAWRADSGFYLNDEPVKIKGVCLHHDLGCLGAAFYRDAARRQLQRMKEMGANAIRTSHNPPAPELLDLCDRMGLLVINETFDVWNKQKSPHDYSRFFEEWHERDLTDHLLRDRNHPSVFMWSIGNEVGEQWNSHPNDADSTSRLCRTLADLCRTLDPTRPVTAGCNEVNPSNPLFAPGALDVIGFNYHEDEFESVPEKFPGRPFIVTESTSALMSRGEYDFPADSAFIRPLKWDIPFDLPQHTCSSFDHCHAPWGTTHEKSWHRVKTQPHTSGLFVWTGFDYLGEPTPYGWPSRSSFFGICDLAGFPKDVYYMYQSEWTDRPVLHLFPHWNWREGQLVDVWAYYNRADEVELFLNGKSLGKRTKSEGVYHVAWRVPFASGTLKAVSSMGGKQVLVRQITTAGSPAAIQLTVEPGSTEERDTERLRFVSATVIDKQGNPLPQAQVPLLFTTNNGIDVVGTDNGDPNDSVSLRSPRRTTYNGKALVVLKTAENRNKQPGILRVEAPGLPPAEVIVWPSE